MDVLIGHAALFGDGRSPSYGGITAAQRPRRPAATPPRLRVSRKKSRLAGAASPKPRFGRWNFKIGPEYAIITRQNIAASLGIGCMNFRHGLPASSAIVSVLWLAATSDSRAAEERPASFDCAKDRAPLASIVCSDQGAILAERRTAIAYLALFFSLDENGRARFRNDHLRWVNDLTARCIASPSALQRLFGTAPTTASRECVSRAYMLRTELYRRKLHGSALEEANLSPNELRKIQRRLVELKFLSGSIDGTFGVETRTAIRNYQSSIDHDQANFLTAEERNILLAPSGAAPQPSPRAQPSAPAEAAASPPMRVPETAPEVPPTFPPPQLSAGQSNPNPESGPPNLDTIPLAAEPSAQPALVEGENRSREAVAERAREPATRSVDEPRPPSFTRVALPLWIGILAGMALVLSAGVVLFRRLRTRRALEAEEASPGAPAPSGTGLSPPDPIPTVDDQSAAAGPPSEPESPDRQAGTEAALSEDAIASMIANLVRNAAHPSSGSTAAALPHASSVPKQSPHCDESADGRQQKDAGQDASLDIPPEEPGKIIQHVSAERDG
jgi:peptidoglycan hydrolase-like protein with peptidoglycan-binding domain